jgi:hypothetical protein
MKISRELSQIFAQVYNRRMVNKLAIQTAFVKRKSSVIDGFEFLLAMSLGRFLK